MTPSGLTPDEEDALATICGRILAVTSLRAQPGDRFHIEEGIASKCGVIYAVSAHMRSTLNRPRTTFPDAETTLGLNLSRQMHNPGGNAHDIKKAIVNGIRASAASIAKRYGPILNDPESSDALCSLVHIAQLLAENCEMQEPVAAVGLEMVQLTGMSHQDTTTCERVLLVILACCTFVLCSPLIFSMLTQHLYASSSPTLSKRCRTRQALRAECHATQRSLGQQLVDAVRDKQRKQGDEAKASGLRLPEALTELQMKLQLG